MAAFIKFRNSVFKSPFQRLETPNPNSVFIRHFHIRSKLELSFPNSSSSSTKIAETSVAIFWDLDNKPPKSVPPYEAAVKLKAAMATFGAVRSMVAYANRHSFSYVPQAVRSQRRERKLLDQLENKRVIRSIEPYLCRVCGRNFYTNEKLVNHFKQIHEREQQKRLNQIESAKGSRRVKLLAKYSMKFQKYRNAAKDVLTPKIGYGLGDELKRAGFFVKTVSDKPEAADIALKNHMVEMMDRRRVECLVLVSDDSDFVSVLKEAKLRCLKTVVVGDIGDGPLKRSADTGFSWKEILLGKAKKEAVSVLGKWKDRDVLKRLEWTYNPELEKEVCDSDEDEEALVHGESCGNMQKVDSGAWWELNSDTEMVSSDHVKE